MSVSNEKIQAVAKALAEWFQLGDDGRVITKDLEILLAIFYLREIAIGEHCCWDGRLLGKSTWHKLRSRLSERLYPLVTADRRNCPEPQIDLVYVDSTREALLYFNEGYDERIGLTPLGRKVAKAMIAQTLVTMNK